MSEDDYLGYVILQSLADKSWLDRVRIEARRQIGTWTFLLVRPLRGTEFHSFHSAQ